MEKIMESLPFMLEGSVVTIEIFALTLVLSFSVHFLFVRKMYTENLNSLHMSYI